MQRTWLVPAIVWIRVRHDEMACRETKGRINDLSRGPKSRGQEVEALPLTMSGRTTHRPAILTIQVKQFGALRRVKGRVLRI